MSSQSHGQTGSHAASALRAPPGFPLKESEEKCYLNKCLSISADIIWGAHVGELWPIINSTALIHSYL